MSTTTPVKYYFGQRWDSPMFDEPGWVQVETPAGRTCGLCHEVIQEGDQGQYLAGVVSLGSRTGAVLNATHIQCLMLTTIGHQYGVCGCTGYQPGARARQVLIEKIDAERGLLGLGPWAQHRQAVPRRRWLALLRRGNAGNSR
jgi:hypothetical protein